MAEPPETPDLPEHLPPEQRVNILLVDDQPANLLALEVILQDLGHNLVQARSGEEALRRLAGGEFALILLDVRMPGLDGFETARLIRGREESRHTPIIFLTAFESDRFLVGRAYSLGAVDYLVKPLVPAIVRAKVAGLVELFEKTQQVKRQAERIRQMERREFEERLAEENARLRASEARKAAILETALDGIITIDHQGRILEFNPAAETTFGFRRAEVLGQPMAELLVPPSLREQHYRGLARYLATGEGPVLNRRVEMPARRADGTEFPVEVTITRIATEGPPLFTAYLRDITDRKRLERRRSARLALTQILGEATTLQEAAPHLVRAVCEGLGWDAGAFWAVDPHAGVLRCLESWHLPAVPEAAWGAFCRRQTFPPGVGLPGRIWGSGRPAWVADVTEDADAPRTPVAAPEGLHAAFGSPIRLGREVLGVLEFFSHEVRERDDDLLNMLATVGGQIGQFMERREAQSQLRRQEEERRIARRVQQGLLPKAVPTLPGFRVGGRSAAASDVGGDCFDFLPLRAGGGECLGVLVADASGHGIGAALLAGQARAYLRALALTCADVGTLLTLSNQRLPRSFFLGQPFAVTLVRTPTPGP
jgi:PAS domain S-box-containing protein